MSGIFFVFFALGTYALVAAITSMPLVLLSFRRVDWRIRDGLVLVIPFVIWVGMHFTGLRWKSLVNVLWEPAYLGLAVPIAVAVRIFAGQRNCGRLCISCLIALLCIAAIMIYLLVPPYPE
jgi:hypothetical protein